jgi:signal peptidase I
MATTTSDANEPERRRIAPVVLAIFFPGSGYFALGRWSFGFGFSIALGALSYLACLAAADNNLTLCALAFAAMTVLWLASVVHVGFAIGNAGRRPRAALVVAAILALIVVGNLEAAAYRRSLVEAFKIPSGSMIPTLQWGDHVFVDKRAVTPKRGDVIVFNYMRDPSKQFIKRCIATGGDMVEMREDIPVVNGVPLEDKPVPGPCAYEDYDEQQDRIESRQCLAFEETLDGRTFGIIHDVKRSFTMPKVPPTQIPAGGCWVLGDNRDNSHDSRAFGAVPAENIVGTARLIFWGRGSGRIGSVR